MTQDSARSTPLDNEAFFETERKRLENAVFSRDEALRERVGNEILRDPDYFQQFQEGRQRSTMRQMFGDLIF